ncbi:MAG: protein kinase [Victivallales bacterium]|nr:protein kinase [Victivallales bacterium]
MKQDEGAENIKPIINLSDNEDEIESGNKTKKFVPGERRLSSMMEKKNEDRDESTGDTGSMRASTPPPRPQRRTYIQTPADLKRELNAMYDAAQNAPYELSDLVARGAEAVLYRANCGEFMFCSKSIRNGLSKYLGASVSGHAEKLENVKYSTKLRHVQNEFEISKKLNQMEPMPVVRMFGLRKVKRFGMEVGYDLLMEYLDGHDLGDKVVGRVLSVEDKIKVVYQAAQALDYVHKHKVVHLDIKPSNFMLVKGAIKLIDFGVSVAIGHRASAVTGTGGYLSPEQVCKDVIDEKTDIFAFGVTFAVLFGAKPLSQPQKELISTKGRQEARYQMESMDQPMLSDIPGLSQFPAIAEILRMCTVPRRDRRIASCNQFILMLKQKAEQYNIVL